jgi:hypothetical protein
MPSGKVHKCMTRKHEPYEEGRKPCKGRCGRYTANLSGLCTRCLNKTLPLERKVKEDAKARK